MLRVQDNIITTIHSQVLEALHEDYVVVQADKAGNNVIIICKQYYNEVLTKELKNNSGASTYLLCNEPVDEVIQSYIGFMEPHGIDVPEDFI